MGRPTIELSHVDKVFRGSIQALQDCSLEIVDNEFAVLLGPSGCGKSTLMNILAGFEDATGGTVTVEGEAVDASGPDRAVVFQEAALFPWLTAWENVTMGPRLMGMGHAEVESRARELLASVGLADFHHSHPSGLSGGMKQRVGIARALALAPRVMLLDEPFGALDAQTRLSMQELLLDVWETHRTTVLFITHDIDEAILLADTVYIMSARPGRIVKRMSIDLPRPRRLDLLTDTAFNALRKEIMETIRVQATATAA